MVSKFLLLLAFFLSLNAAGSSETASVIIVGAGMSGIMAAKTLSEHGVKDFLILEATDLIGGRMRNVPFAGAIVEIGANWVEGVHGPKMNPIWELAKKYQMRTFQTDFGNYSHNIYNKKGPVPFSSVKKESKLSDAESDYVEKLGISKSKNGESDISILTAQRLFGSIPTSPIEMVLEYQNYDFEFAEPPRITSLKNTQPGPTFEDFGDDEFFVADPRGYSFLVHQLAKSFLHSTNGTLDDKRLMLSKVVRKIEYSKTGVVLSTEDGGTYKGKFSVVTVSLGVMQSKLIKFQPPLPAWKLESLFQFDMAIYTKIFLRFPYTFWPTNPGSQIFLYADEKRGYYSTWQHLAKEFPGKNMMFVTVTDDESRRIEQLSDMEIKAEIMLVLRRMFGDGIPEIEEIYVPRWGHMKYFKGSYSNWPIGVDDYEFHAIQAPVHSLYFAGEHTSQKYNGYVHGAYLTGIDAGIDLLRCMKTGNCTKYTPEAYKKVNSNGVCQAAVMKERETMRQAWSKKADAVKINCKAF